MGTQDRSRDPFWDDGVGARRARTRRRRISRVALAIAIVAVGLTAAVWILAFDPTVSPLGLL